jgi:cytochrome o ubiquinol oxidase subunit 1
VTGRDAFWEMKRLKGHTAHKPEYEDIQMPKNTPLGLYIAAFSFLFGFAVIWHIIWLIPVGLIGIVACLIIRVSDDETEYTVTAKEVAAIEAGLKYKGKLV